MGRFENLDYSDNKLQFLHFFNLLIIQIYTHEKGVLDHWPPKKWILTELSSKLPLNFVLFSCVYTLNFCEFLWQRCFQSTQSNSFPPFLLMNKLISSLLTPFVPYLLPAHSIQSYLFKSTW